MTCDEAEILLHALIDGELDAGHAREVEDAYRDLPALRGAACEPIATCSQADRGADVRFTAPPALRRRIEAALPQPPHGAEPARGARRALRLGIGGLGDRRAPASRRHRAASDDEARIQSRSGVGASALAAGRTSDRRGVDRPAHGQAVVQRQARRGAAGGRPHRAGLYADRRPARLRRRAPDRRHRLPPPLARHQSVRGADRHAPNAAPPKSRRCRASTSGAGANAV